MAELFKRIYQIFCEKLWLKAIDKSIDRYKKVQNKANREYNAMQKLCERYNELFHRNLMGVEDGN